MGILTIHGIISGGQDGAKAIGALNRSWLTFSQLRNQVKQTVGALNSMGIGRNDRVAIVLPNGPEMAVSFLAVGSGATAAPLNPMYVADEFRFYLSDLGAKALLAAEGSDTAATQAAAEMGLMVIDLSAREDAAAGLFDLKPRIALKKKPPLLNGLAGPDDQALVLHTSGTTSRPKIVPLLHKNACVSAANIKQSLALGQADRCLNIMPLFHIHGLMSALLASLAAGGSVFCSPGYDALKFFSWLDAAQPTWFTAVPTMLQTIAARALRNPDSLKRAQLRFIRSSSASLPPTVMAELEKLFEAPVIEAYGMTEATHQMSCNPLPPLLRKPGFVGIAAGPKMAIMDEQGTLRAPGEVGEIVIRGDNVFSGYEANQEANAKAFANGWFRTGDQGVMDEKGYFRITGRLKEIINRGGEKVSPIEVEEVLLHHPGVAQAVVFAIPHDKLGEDIAAAIVLCDGAKVSERELREYAAQHLAAFKSPRKVLFMDEIPKGATGKLQRIGLAAKLGLA